MKTEDIFEESQRLELLFLDQPGLVTDIKRLMDSNLDANEKFRQLLLHIVKNFYVVTKPNE